MNSLIRIQGKVIEVKPAKSGYYITIQTTGKRQRAFSQWKLKEGIYSLNLRQDNEYFFIVNYQVLEAKVDLSEAVKRAKQESDRIEAELREQGDIIYQPYKEKEEQNDRKAIRELEARLKQAETSAWQWKNAYYNQKSMLKQAQRNSQQCTVENRIKALENKPGKKSKQDLDYLQLLIEFNRECKENWAWLNSD